MLNKDIKDVFIHNYDEHPENPYIALNLNEGIRNVIRKELPLIIKLEELDEFQWNYLKSKMIDMIKHELRLIEVDTPFQAHKYIKNKQIND